MKSFVLMSVISLFAVSCGNDRLLTDSEPHSLTETPVLPAPENSQAEGPGAEASNELALSDTGKCRDRSHLNRHVNHILREMNPSAPPPLQKFSADKQQEIWFHVQQLMIQASAGLAVAMQAVTDHEPLVDKSWDMDPDSPEAMEILQQAIHLRYEYTQTFYITYKALRGFIQGAESYGFKRSLVTAQIEPWIFGQLSKFPADMTEWDWGYASMYPLLKHRLMVLCAEAQRLNQQRPDLGKIKTLPYDDLRAGFLEVTDLDLDQFPANLRDRLQDLKYTAWADLLHWHISLGDADALDKADDIWQGYRIDNPNALDQAGPGAGAAAGYLHIVGARVYAARDELAKARHNARAAVDEFLRTECAFMVDVH